MIVSHLTELILLQRIILDSPPHSDNFQFALERTPDGAQRCGH